MEDYPSSAYILTLLGAIISLLFGLVGGVVGIAAVMSGFLGGTFCLTGLLGGLLGLVAAFLMKTPQKVHDGGVLAIIAAILSMGSILPFILMLIGGIMALSWRPRTKAVILPPPPPA